MTRYARLAVLLLPVAVGLASQVPAGRAQVPDDRYAFADTTLLRDTLGLRFDGLFRLADSLGLTPDTLRAYSIRHRMSLARLVAFADSIGMPVDSVGPVLWRERFNPLSARRVRVTDFVYTSSYDLRQTTSDWDNLMDFNLVRGPIFVRSQTNVGIQRQQYGDETSVINERNSINEGGYRLSPDLSLGLQVTSNGYESSNPRSQIMDAKDLRNEVQLSTRTRQRPSAAWTSEINALAGVLDANGKSFNGSSDKQGWSGGVNGRARYQRPWIAADVNANLNGNVSTSRLPGSPTEFGTEDLNTTVDGTVGMFSTSPLSTNMTYRIQNNRTESVTDSSGIRRFETANSSVNLSVRLRQDNDRYITVSPRWGTSRQVTATNTSSLTTRDDLGLSVTGRYRLAGWSLDGTFTNTLSNLEYPTRSTTGGYGDDGHTRAINGIISRRLWSRFVLKGEGRVTLASSRYYPVGVYPNPPSNRDTYRQQFRIDGTYEPTTRFTTGAGIEVIRNHLINLPSAATAANNELRSYKAEWRWTYKLLPGLTANQINQMSADYTYFDFLRSSNKLVLDYRIFTTLSAVLGPHTLIRLDHDTRTQPSGLYAPLADGLEYFSQNDEGRNYTLRAMINYAPSPVFSLRVQSDYLAVDRFGQTAEGQVRQRESRALQFTGGMIVNVPLGPKGQLIGDLSRNYRSDGLTTFANGIPQPSTPSEQDYWTGRVELKWAP